MKISVELCCTGALFLENEHSVLNQRLISRDSKPNSWYTFTFEVPRVAPL